MKQIYNFEKGMPPALNERQLRMKLEKRRLQRQTVLLAAAGIFSQIFLLLLGVLFAEFYPVITFACFGYVLVSAMGIAAAAVVLTRKRRFLS